MRQTDKPFPDTQEKEKECDLVEPEETDDYTPITLYKATYNIKAEPMG